MKRWISGLILASLAACKAAGSLASDVSSVASDSLTATQALDNAANPVIDHDFADPAVLATAEGYYAYATNAAGKNIQVRSARDLVHWSDATDALPYLPSWAKAGFTWAPDVSNVATAADAEPKYVMYFTARVADVGKQCVGVATSTKPEGPFVPQGDGPLICPIAEGGAIDAAGFADEDGQRYVVWKNDGNSQGMTTKIYLQKVDASGTSIAGPAVELIHNDAWDWEGAVVEAPTLHFHNQVYYLFYSANNYQGAQYTVGYATADNIAGPYTKQGRWLQSSNNNGPVIGPGGQYIFTDPQDKAVYMAYHTWAPDMNYRAMSVERLNWSQQQPILTATWGIKPLN